MYDISTSKETQITTNVSNQYSPAIYGDRIVYMDDRKSDENPLNHDDNPENGQSITDIYMYDFSTNKETPITANGLYNNNADVYGNGIVWDNQRDGKSNIYMCTVSGEESEPVLPVASFSSNVTEGYIPLDVKFKTYLKI